MPRSTKPRMCSVRGAVMPMTEAGNAGEVRPARLRLLDRNSALEWCSCVQCNVVRRIWVALVTDCRKALRPQASQHAGSSAAEDDLTLLTS